MNEQNKTVLVTGATSGVGFEAAAQFAEAGYGTVVIAARSEAKAAAARDRLTERTGKRGFEILAIDTAEVDSANAAADVLRERGTVVDVLVLNAGASLTEPTFNSDGVEMTWASTLVGHHVLTMRLVAGGGLSPRARIVIAGSEGARGNLPGMKVHDIDSIAAEHFGGDRSAAITALAKVKHQASFVNMNEYVTAKRVVAWWAAALARRLPAGMTVNAVSPGSAPSSGFARHAGGAMKVMVAVMKVVGPLMKMAGGLDVAARRYLDAAELADDATGNFYATVRRNKLVGPMGVQTWPESLMDERSQEAAFEAVVDLTRTAFPEPHAAAIG